MADKFLSVFLILSTSYHLQSYISLLIISYSSGKGNTYEHIAVENQILEYGQTPRQLFTQPHPTRNNTLLNDPALKITQSSNPALNITQSSNPALDITQSSDPALDIIQSNDPALNITQSSNPALNITQSSDPALDITQSNLAEAKAVVNDITSLSPVQHSVDNASECIEGKFTVFCYVIFV